MKKVVFHILVVMLAGSHSFGQTTFVPDTNLRKVLVNRYSGFMDANGQIVNARAANYTGAIDCSYQRIKDLTGLWKFTGLTSLACQFNAISNLDSLNRLTNLTSLYAFNNNISRLPDLQPLSKLSYLSCGSNRLSTFPDLSSHTPLTYLDCSRNAIQNIAGIDRLVNLQMMIVNENKLDSLPSLSNLSKLQVLICHTNNLGKLKGLSQLAQLTVFIAGENKFDSLDELSSLANLNVLMAWNCRLKSVPDVSKMKNLAQLVLDGNQIRSVPSLSANTNLSMLKLSNNLIEKLPDISACKNTLKIFKLDQNFLDSLPDFSGFPLIDSVYVQNNRLTFEDILPLAHRTNLKYLNYSPQDSIGTKQDYVLDENQSFKFALGIDKKVTNNQYDWYKNGQFLKTTFSDTLLISKLTLADSGTYTCVVRNPQAPLLTLKCRPIKVRFKPCLDLAKLTYTATNYDCNFGGTVTIKEESILGGQKPYSYKLVSNELGIARFPNGNTFTNLFENAYTLEVKDRVGCKVVFGETVLLKGKNGPDCKRLVIVGDDSSPNNSLFFDEKGTAKVYNNEGQLVQAFNTPNSWDGRNQNGEFLPGYYVIDLNGKMMNVTLVK